MKLEPRDLKKIGWVALLAAILIALAVAAGLWTSAGARKAQEHGVKKVDVFVKGNLVITGAASGIGAGLAREARQEAVGCAHRP